MSKYSWTEDEITYLLNNWQNHTWKEIGIALGRSMRAIETKASELHLKKRKNITGFSRGLLPIDTMSREYPNVPLWMRISEAHPQIQEPQSNYTVLRFVQVKALREEVVETKRIGLGEYCKQYQVPYGSAYRLARIMRKELAA